jgi:hypothetical protein
MEYSSSTLYGRTVYQIAGDSLVISRTRSFADFRAKILLSSLNSEYESLWVMRPLIWVGASLSAVGVVGSIIVGESSQIRNWWFFVWLFAIFAVLGGVITLFSLRRIKIVRFLYLGGTPAVDIIHGQSSKIAFEEFITEVQSSIRGTKQDEKTA